MPFIHQCAKTRKGGRFIIHRHSASKRMIAKLLEILSKLRKRINPPLGETAGWLKPVVQGWLNYHAVLSNSHWIWHFVGEVSRHWLWTICRRSRRGKSSWTWNRMHKLVRRLLPRSTFWGELDVVLALIERNLRSHHFDPCGFRWVNFWKFSSSLRLSETGKNNIAAP